MYNAMAILGMSRQTMSNIFIMMIVCGSLVFSTYVILSTKLGRCMREGLDAMCKNEGCSQTIGDSSAHEVPIWEGSLIPESVPKKNREIDREYAKSVEPTRTSSKYNFLENEIEVEEAPVEKPVTERKFLGDIDINQSSTVRRPKATSTNFVKRQKGTPSGLGFNTGAIN